MPNQKPPTQLDDCIFQAANHSLSIDKAIAELAALRADAQRWRKRKDQKDGWDSYDTLRTAVTKAQRIVGQAMTDTWNDIVDDLDDSPQPRKDDNNA